MADVEADGVLDENSRPEQAGTNQDLHGGMSSSATSRPSGRSSVRRAPVISVDTKKKELIGNFRNPGEDLVQEACGRSTSTI